MDNNLKTTNTIRRGGLKCGVISINRFIKELNSEISKIETDKYNYTFAIDAEEGRPLVLSAFKEILEKLKQEKTQ